jgi:hypothetical protein
LRRRGRDGGIEHWLSDGDRAWYGEALLVAGASLRGHSIGRDLSTLRCHWLSQEQPSPPRRLSSVRARDGWVWVCCVGGAIVVMLALDLAH